MPPYPPLCTTCGSFHQPDVPCPPLTPAEAQRRADQQAQRDVDEEEHDTLERYKAKRRDQGGETAR